MTDLISKYLKVKYLIPTIIIIVLLPSVVKSLLLSFGNISSYYQLYYFIGYEYGFGGRKLLGTLFSSILPDYVSHQHLIPIIWGINLLFLFSFIFLLSKGLIEAQKKGVGLGLILIYALWFISPFSISKYYTQGLNIMFPEIWSMTLVLAFLIANKYGNNSWWYCLLTFLICILSCLIHHVFCCLFFPLVLSIFVDDIISEHNNGSIAKIKAFIYFIISLTLTVLFIAIWLFSHMNTSIDDIFNIICNRTDPNICPHDKDAIDQLYYMSNIENSRNVESFYISRTKDLILTVIITSPLIFILTYPWYSAYKNVHTKTLKWRYILVGIIPTVVYAPIYFFAVDYGRWEYAWFFNYLCLLVFFIWKGDVAIIASIKKMKIFAKKYPIIVVVLAIYLAIIPASNAWSIPLIHKVANFFL